MRRAFDARWFDRLPKTLRIEWKELTKISNGRRMWHSGGVILCLLFTYCNILGIHCFGSILFISLNFDRHIDWCGDQSKCNSFELRVRSLNIMIVLYCLSMPWRWPIRQIASTFVIEMSLCCFVIIIGFAAKPRLHFSHRRTVIFTLFSAQHLLDVAQTKNGRWDETEYNKCWTFYPVLIVSGRQFDFHFISFRPKSHFPSPTRRSLFSILCPSAFGTKNSYNSTTASATVIAEKQMASLNERSMPWKKILCGINFCALNFDTTLALSLSLIRTENG